MASSSGSGAALSELLTRLLWRLARSVTVDPAASPGGTAPPTVRSHHWLTGSGGPARLTSRSCTALWSTMTALVVVGNATTTAAILTGTCEPPMPMSITLPGWRWLLLRNWRVAMPGTTGFGGCTASVRRPVNESGGV